VTIEGLGRDRERLALEQRQVATAALRPLIALQCGHTMCIGARPMVADADASAASYKPI
jgi:hypothetical protein